MPDSTPASEPDHDLAVNAVLAALGAKIREARNGAGVCVFNAFRDVPEFGFDHFG